MRLRLKWKKRMKVKNNSYYSVILGAGTNTPGFFSLSSVMSIICCVLCYDCFIGWLIRGE